VVVVAIAGKAATPVSACRQLAGVVEHGKSLKEGLTFLTQV
jgi:hypothetical protein